MKKLLATAAVALLPLGLAGTAAASPGTTHAVPAKGAARFAHAAQVAYDPPPLTFGKCADPEYVQLGFQCGTLTVPLDYAHPDGTKITLAITRLEHTVPTSKYQGVMLTNPGGPGGSGTILPVLENDVPNNAGAAYDWIGFDPRGVGESTPSLTCNSNFFHTARPPYDPTTRSAYETWIARSKRYAAECTHATGSALFDHVKTVDNARDMDSLRKALGQQQINYYGFSYGTYLGQVYMTLFPDRVRRVVLDSSVDPQRVFYKSNQDQDRAFQKTFDIYFHWLAKYHAVYHVGDTYAQVRRTFLLAEKFLDSHPAKGQLGGDELLDVFTSAGYYVYGWEDIAKAWSAYLNKGNAQPLIDMYTSANPTTAGGDNGYAVYLGTQCTDAPWPTDQSTLNADNERLNRNYNYFTWSNAWFNGPCAYWHYKARQPITVTGHDVHVPILMIDETYDAATPFPGNLVVRKLFPTASLIEGKDGSTHAGSLSGVPCTDDTIAAYLRSGTLPVREPGNHSDKVCPPVPQPDPTAGSSARTQRTSSVPPAVRRELAGILRP